MLRISMIYVINKDCDNFRISHHNSLSGMFFFINESNIRYGDMNRICDNVMSFVLTKI